MVDIPDFFNNQVIDEATMDDMMSAIALALEQVSTSTQLTGFNTDVVISTEAPDSSRARVGITGGSSSIAVDRSGNRMPVAGTKIFHFLFDDVNGDPIDIPSAGNHRVIRVVMEYVQDTVNDTTVSGNARTRLIDNKKIYSIGGTEVLVSATAPQPVAPGSSIVLADVTIPNKPDEDFTISGSEFSQVDADFMYKTPDNLQASNPTDLAAKLQTLLTTFSYGWIGTAGEDDFDLGDSTQQLISNAGVTETISNTLRYLFTAIQTRTPISGVRAGLNSVGADVSDVGGWTPGFDRGTRDIDNLASTEHTGQKLIKKMVTELGALSDTNPGSYVVGAPVNVSTGVAPQWPQDAFGKKWMTNLALTQIEHQTVGAALRALTFEIGATTRSAASADQLWDIPGADNVGVDFSGDTPIPTVTLGTASPTQYSGDGPAFNEAREYFGNAGQNADHSLGELAPRKNVTSAVAAIVDALEPSTSTVGTPDDDGSFNTIRHDVPLGMQCIGGGNFSFQVIGQQSIELLRSRETVIDGSATWSKYVTALSRDQSIHSMWANLCTQLGPNMLLSDKWVLPYNNDINGANRSEGGDIVHAPQWTAVTPFSLSAPNGEYATGDTRAENAGAGTNIIAPDTLASLQKQVDTAFDLVIEWRVGRNWPYGGSQTAGSSTLRPPIAFRLYKTCWGIALTWNLEISNAFIIHGGQYAGEPNPTVQTRPNSALWREETIRIKRDKIAYDGHMMFFGDAMRAFRWAGDNTTDWTTNTGVTLQLIGTKGTTQGLDNSLTKGFPSHEHSRKTGGFIDPDVNTLCMPLCFITLKVGLYTADNASVDAASDGADWPKVEHLARAAGSAVPAFIGFCYQVSPGAQHPDALLTSHSMGFIHNLLESDA